jgi:hypothetical protein
MKGNVSNHSFEINSRSRIGAFGGYLWDNLSIIFEGAWRNLL